MLTVADLRAIATARLEDGKALLAAGRYDWAVYTCGYAVECALKARIVVTLNWPGFPSTPKEFERFKSFKTHDLETLLLLTGMDQQIRLTQKRDWSEVSQWNPENRYKAVGATPPSAARDMVDATGRLLTAI